LTLLFERKRKSEQIPHQLILEKHD